MINNRCINDLSTGIGIKPKELRNVLNRINKEFVTMQDLRQLSSMGIPIFGALSVILNTPMPEIKDKVKNRKIRYDNIEKVIEYICRKDGNFYGLHKAMKNSNLNKLQKACEKLRQQLLKAMLKKRLDKTHPL